MRKASPARKEFFATWLSPAGVGVDSCAVSCLGSPRKKSTAVANMIAGVVFQFTVQLLAELERINMEPLVRKAVGYVLPHVARDDGKFVAGTWKKVHLNLVDITNKT